MTLPPMPTGHTIGCGIFNGQKLFTADQMRAYAEQAVAAERERCAHPPQQRRPLSDEQINRLDTEAIHGGPDSQYAFSFARAIERAHGITGEQE